MQYLVVSFLKWVATSCGMWGSLTYLSTPSFAAKFPRVDLQVAVVHQVHPVPLDRRALVARQVHRVQVAHRDRSAAVDPLVLIPEADLDPKEALAPPDKAAAQGAADTLDPVATQAAAAPPARAAHRVALVPVAALVRPGVAAPRAAQGHRAHLAHLAHLGRQVRLERAAVHRVDPVVLGRQVRVVHRGAARRGVDPRAVAHQVARGQKAALVPVAHRAPSLLGAVARAAAVRKVDREVSPDPALNPALNPARSRARSRARNPDRSQVRSQVRKAAANHQDPDHRAPVVAVQARVVPSPAALVPAVPAPAASRQAEATAADPVRADRDLAPDRAVVLVQAPAAKVRAVSAQAALVPAVSAARGNRMDRAATVVAPRMAVAARVQQAVAVARAITNGMDSVGLPSACPTRALLRWDRFKRSAFAPETSRRVPAHTWAKPSTQDAKRGRYE